MTSSSADDPFADRSGSSVGTDEVVIPVGHERAVIEKSEIESVEALVRLRTYVEETSVVETLRVESVRIERVPMDRILSEAPVQRVEGDVTIVPVVEEVLVKQFRLVEEIRIVRHHETDEFAETVMLRRQEAIVEGVSRGSQDDEPD